MNTKFSGQIFEKFSDTKFHENPAGGSRTVPRRRSARHDETNSRLSQFCEGAWWVTHELLSAKKRFEVVVAALLLAVQYCSRCVTSIAVWKVPHFQAVLGRVWPWNSLRNVGSHAHGNSATSQKRRHFLMMTFTSCWLCGISLGAQELLVKWSAGN